MFNVKRQYFSVISCLDHYIYDNKSTYTILGYSIFQTRHHFDNLSLFMLFLRKFLLVFISHYCVYRFPWLCPYLLTLDFVIEKQKFRYISILNFWQKSSLVFISYFFRNYCNMFSILSIVLFFILPENV